MATEDPLERVHVDAAPVERDAEHACTGRLQRRQRADEGGRFAYDNVAWADNGAADQIDALPRAGRDDELVGRLREPADVAAAGQLHQQFGYALGLGVAEHRAPVRPE